MHRVDQSNVISLAHYRYERQKEKRLIDFQKLKELIERRKAEEETNGNI